MGVSVFFDHAINISGGINPNRVSEIKKVIKMPILEKVSVMCCKTLLILKTYSLTKKTSNTTPKIGKKAFFKLVQTKR